MHLIFNLLTVYSFGNRLLFNLDYVSMGLNSFSQLLCVLIGLVRKSLLFDSNKCILLDFTAFGHNPIPNAFSSLEAHFHLC